MTSTYRELVAQREKLEQAIRKERVKYLRSYVALIQKNANALELKLKAAVDQLDHELLHMYSGASIDETLDTLESEIEYYVDNFST